MRLVVTTASCAGAVLFILLVSAGGTGPIWHSARLAGAAGFTAVTSLHLALMGLMGAAWWLLEGTSPGRWPHFAWGRAIRDSAAEALPLSQLGGYVIGARAMVLAGVPGVFAAASTVVDVTVELVAQLGYTALGLALLDRLRPGSGLAGPVLAGVAAMAVLVVAFIAAQAHGVGAAERCGARLARMLLGRGLDRAGGDAGQVQASIRALHAGPAILLAACAVHGAAWLLNGVETWLTLRLMGVALSVPEALVIDSLLCGAGSAEEAEQSDWLARCLEGKAGRRVAMFSHQPLFVDDPDEGNTGYWGIPPRPRGALRDLLVRHGVALIGAFVVPSAIGVQEGGLVLLCGLFDVGADTALALSLIKRARDLLIGVPVLLAWQGLEGRHAWGAARASPVQPVAEPGSVGRDVPP